MASTSDKDNNIGSAMKFSEMTRSARLRTKCCLGVGAMVCRCDLKGNGEDLCLTCTYAIKFTHVSKELRVECGLATESLTKKQFVNTARRQTPLHVPPPADRLRTKYYVYVQVEVGSYCITLVRD